MNALHYILEIKFIVLALNVACFVKFTVHTRCVYLRYKLKIWCLVFWNGYILFTLFLEGHVSLWLVIWFIFLFWAHWKMCYKSWLKGWHVVLFQVSFFKHLHWTLKNKDRIMEICSCQALKRCSTRPLHLENSDFGVETDSLWNC